ncbi:PEP-CTERM sorting domain-containing protein [Sphaerotilus sp.]|uniref:PEP-CTERM sorting domain-containing protein n=1 Tax=Sphaerotilus sp. TaxID=2093942 RepID=UPI0034E2C379
MSIRSTATRLGLTTLLLTGSLQAQAYIEQEQSTGIANDAPSMAETVGTLSPGGYLFISGARRTEAGVLDGGGGNSADFFRFDVGSALSATLTIETPTAAAKPVIGLFDNTQPEGVLLASAFDDNSTPSTFLSFTYQLQPGTYYAAVSGFRLGWSDFDGGGNSGWTYNLVLSSPQLQAAAVPEPESVAMMLAGLGLLGMVSRRRRG